MAAGALAILAANASHAGQFRWLLVVDDDSVLFMRRLMERLQTVDHRLPLLLGRPVKSHRRNHTCDDLSMDSPPGTRTSCSAFETSAL